MRNSNLITAATGSGSHQRPPRRRNLRVALALAGGLTVAIGPVRRAMACWYDPIIFDPQALVEHVQQGIQLAQQIEAAVQQVQGQLQGLAHVDGSVAPNVPGVVAGLSAQLDTSLYQTPNPASQLGNRYPADMGGATWAQVQADQTTWTADSRQSLVENRQLENQVYRDMQTTRQQVQRIVEASNGAPGETAAVQAHNDLLAVASGELAKLQALKAARSRLRTELLARRQSELSYADAEQGRVRAGWDNPSPPTGTVTPAFQN